MKNKKIKFDESVHYDIKGRKKYKAKLWIVFLILIVVLILCSVMFYFGCYSWDPSQDFKPKVGPTEPWQIALDVCAAIIALGALVGTFLYCWFDINKFYRTQEQYWKTKKFQKAKQKALKGDLTQLSKSTIKWYKKLGYITAAEKREILAQKKNKK